MRKFIKEISALIASVSVGTAAAAAISTASENTIQTSETSAIPVETTTEEFIPLGGVTVPPDTTLIMGGMMPPDNTEPATEEIPPLGGVPLPPDEYIEPTTDEFPPLEGIPMMPDEYIEATTEEIPPLAGEPMPPDEYIESTTEVIPPLAGDVAPPDGDINHDGSFNTADVVTFQNGLLNPSEMPVDWYNADLYNDGQLDVFDLVMMKRKLVDTVLSDKQLISSTDIIELSEKGYDLTWADLEEYKCEDIGSGLIVMEYKFKDMNGRFRFIVGGTNDEIIYARLETANGSDSIDIREDEDVLAFISRYNPPA